MSLEVKKTPEGMEYVEVDGMIIRNSIEPGRLPEETRDEYVIRRRLSNKRVKRYLKGGVFWDTTLLGTKNNAKLSALIEKLIDEENVSGNKELVKNLNELK
jgi:hypothetical protein